MRVFRTEFAFLAMLATLWVCALRAKPAVELQKENWTIDTWQTDDGLPENSATAMVQTPEGYLWFGTFKGLVRFDGIRFTVLDRSTAPELPSDGIVNLHLDRSDRLWVSTLKGLVVHDSAGWRLVRKAPNNDSDYVRTFTERANGDLLLTTFGGKLFVVSDDHLTELPPPPGVPGAGYLGGVDEEGDWWVAQYRFVGRWKQGTWEPMIEARELSATPGTSVGIAQAPGGGLWVLNNSELRKYSHGREVSRRRLEQRPDHVWSLTEDSRGSIWICMMDQGVWQILPNSTVVRWNEQNGLSYAGTRFAFEDREKNVWIGTSGGGLQRFKHRRFKTFGPTDGLSERVIKSVAPDGNEGLWIGTYGRGLFHWTDAGITNVPLPGLTNRNYYIQSVLTDTRNRTWVGTYGLGLLLLDQNAARRFPPKETGGDNVIALFEDSRGRIWTSGGSGVSVFTDKEFKRCGQDLPDSALQGVCAFGEGSDGAVWLSNLEALYRAEQTGLREVKDAGGRSIPGITCIKGDENGSVWMGTTDAGLLRWKAGSFRRVGPESGLGAAAVHAILYDKQGCAWLPSSSGIMRVQRKELESVAEGTARMVACQLLDRDDGLASRECPVGQQPTCARDPSGRLWFATMKGVSMIDPEIFGCNSVAPTVLMENVAYRRNGAGKRGTHLASERMEAPFNEPLQLPAGSRGIEIQYAAPSFVSPRKVKFQIKIDAEESDWLDVGSRRTAYFEELEPGKHVFQVRAANDDGLWSRTAATLAFTVQPFFWQTGTFRGLIAAGLGSLGLLWAYRLRAQFEAKRAAHQAFTRQLMLYQEDERKRVASELHDGLGQDLMLIKNRLGMVTGTVSPETARQLQDISAITSRTITEVRAISHALRPSALEQVGLTKAIEWMVEQLAEGSSSKFLTELHNIDGLLTPEMEINLFRILQEALNNVLKHAQASEVIVEVKREPHGCSVSVFDNGQGFDSSAAESEARRPEGFGLVSMAERARVLGGELQVRSTPGVGTRLTLHVPSGNQNGHV